MWCHSVVKLSILPPVALVPFQWAKSASTLVHATALRDERVTYEWRWSTWRRVAMIWKPESCTVRMCLMAYMDEYLRARLGSVASGKAGVEQKNLTYMLVLALVFKSLVLGPQKDRRPNWTGPKKDRTAVAVQALWWSVQLRLPGFWEIWKTSPRPVATGLLEDRSKV